MSLTWEEIVASVASWKGERLAVTPLGKPLTNTIYRIDMDDASFVLRLPGARTVLLAVDRANEFYNTRVAADAGVCPRVIHHVPDSGAMVLEFIHGTTMTIATLQQPGMPTRMAHVLKRLHAGPRFLHDFNMFRLIELYLKIAAEHGVRIPENYRAYLPQVARIEAAFASRPLPSVPCHNDLLAGNYLDDGQRLWLIDFEYSGNNDPTFELGNTCQEQQFDEARVAEMCAAYFGEAYPDKLARMKLNMILSDVGWTLWAAIQAKISTLDFDFWGWAVERWERALAKMGSAEFASWCEACMAS